MIYFTSLNSSFYADRPGHSLNGMREETGNTRSEIWAQGRARQRDAKSAIAEARRKEKEETVDEKISDSFREQAEELLEKVKRGDEFREGLKKLKQEFRSKHGPKAEGMMNRVVGEITKGESEVQKLVARRIKTDKLINWLADRLVRVKKNWID